MTRTLAVAVALAALPFAFALPAGAQSSCDPSYPDLCVPPAYEVGDLDCVDVGASWFTVYQPDGHGFDADYDGYGCEA